MPGVVLGQGAAASMQQTFLVPAQEPLMVTQIINLSLQPIPGVMGEQRSTGDPSSEWDGGEGRPLRKGRLCRYQGDESMSGPGPGGGNKGGDGWWKGQEVGPSSLQLEL